MRTKNCRVDLVTNTSDELLSLIDKIKDNFSVSQVSNIREVDWRSQIDLVGIDFDYRCSVYFSAEKSKKQIYETMNSIKANPITFLK